MRLSGMARPARLDTLLLNRGDLIEGAGLVGGAAGGGGALSCRQTRGMFRGTVWSDCVWSKSVSAVNHARWPPSSGQREGEGRGCAASQHGK